MAGLRAVAGIAGAALFAAAAGAQQGITVSPPPPTEVREVVDTLHGVDVPDPYRWLEDQEAPETRAWIDAQNAYTDTVLGALPGRDRLRRVARRSSSARPSACRTSVADATSTAVAAPTRTWPSSMSARGSTARNGR